MAEKPENETSDAKARFREALERKKAAGSRSSSGVPRMGGVHGPEVAGGAGRRSFRRKTG